MKKKASKVPFEIMETRSDLENLIAFLKFLKYEVKPGSNNCYDFHGNYIKGVFSDSPEYEACHPDLANKIVFDNKKCFNKIGQCPVALTLPTTKGQFEYLEEQLECIATKAGYEASNAFFYSGYNRIDTYPR